MRAVIKVGFPESTLPKKSNTYNFLDIVHIRMLEISFCAFKSSLPLGVQLLFLKEERKIFIWEIFLMFECLNHAEQEQLGNKNLELVNTLKK